MMNVVHPHLIFLRQVIEHSLKEDYSYLMIGLKSIRIDITFWEVYIILPTRGLITV